MMNLFTKIPKWVKNVPDHDQQFALVQLAKASGGDFSKPREMNFTLYDIEDGAVMDQLKSTITDMNWEITIQPQDDESLLFTITATKNDYSITEEQYLSDVQFFVSLAEECNVGYDGWFASA